MPPITHSIGRLEGQDGDCPQRAPGGRLASAAWVLATTAVLGAFAVWLNGILYERQQPVYDSVSYLERLHRVMSFTRSEGLVRGWQEATDRTTVCLPWLGGLLLAPLVPPARWVGVVLQCVWLAGFLWSLDCWLRRVVGAAGWASRAVVVTSSGSLAVIHYTNGGLSDFRMDLALMLGYGATLCWLGIGLRQRRWGSWMVVGLAAAACCLVRATAPVYLLAAAGPVVGIHLLRAGGSERLRLVRLAGLSVLVAAIAAGWFYVMNGEYLRFYYFVWNTDANARLPLGEALQHFDLFFRGIGWMGSGAAVVLAVLAWWWRKDGAAAGEAAWAAWGWTAEAAWFAAVPVLILVGLRAGLNPFVSMPAVAGCMMLGGGWLAGWYSAVGRGPSGSLRQAVIWGVVLLAVAGAMVRGWKKHRYPNDRFMDAHQKIIDAIVADAGTRGSRHVRFGAIGTADVNSDSLFGVLLYDRPDATVTGNVVRVAGVRLEPDRLFVLPARVNWESVPGGDDVARCRWLAGQVAARMDYVVMPDEETAAVIETRNGHDEVNRRMVRLREEVRAVVPLTRLVEAGAENSSRRFGVFRIERGQ